MSKPAKIKQDLADRCEQIARARRQKTGESVLWSHVMAEALAVGLTALERRGKRK
jgi:hypothetical protein